MKGNKDAVESVNVIPSKVAKKQQSLATSKKETQIMQNEDAKSPDSNAENKTPPSRRRRKEPDLISQSASPKRKGKITNATSDRKMRSATKNSSIADSDSFNNLNGGVPETPEKSKSSEESLCNSSGYENDAENTTQESQNSSIFSDNLENSVTNKRRSSQRRKQNLKKALTKEILVSNEAKEKVALENSEDIKKLNNTVDVVAPIQGDIVNIENTVEIETEIKVEKPETDDETPAEANRASVDDETEKFSIHEDKQILIGLENPIPIQIVNIKSPSAASVDSAKGSSIASDTECTIFASGDLYWGRIHNFTYWACIICSDESEDNLITRLVDQQLEVHVRFFADNARHSWVKRDNLIPYQGLESYRDNIREIKEKYGEKSLKYQAYLPKRNKLKSWLQAVKEADVIAVLPYPERLAKFFQLNQEARERIREERIRRNSMGVGLTTINLGESTSSDQSSYTEDKSKKRNRSESPISPAFSPLSKIKRRKTTADATELKEARQQKLSIDDMGTPRLKLKETEIETEYNTSLKSRKSSEKHEYFDTPEFHQFHDMMKEYVMQGLQSDFVEMNLFVAVKNIWALKNILHKHLASDTQPKTTTLQNDAQAKPLKRLSIRLKDMKQRQSTEVTSPATTNTNQNAFNNNESKRLSNASKPKKVTRPMEEVIDDIFNLDSRYLFDNMGRDPVCKYCLTSDGELKRCSKGCASWLHQNCLQTNTIPGTELTPIKRKSDSHVKRSSIKKENLVPTIPTAPSETIARLPMHVTADTDDNDENFNKLPNGIHTIDSKIEESNINETIICKECENNEQPKCFVCHSSIKKQQTAFNGEIIEEHVVMCNTMHCPRVYHPSCLNYWPQSKLIKSKNSIVSLRCPSHVCHTCVSDDPKGKFQHLNNSNTTKCVKCPATYHMDSTCIPAGSKILSAAHIICPRHGITKSDQNVNVSWCFICVRGGQLICCETCPTAVHAECTNIALDPNECYICDECESGRMPLYGEMVWAKFNNFRWWPAIILPPTEVPLNIRDKPHNPFEFVIRFFGTHDHGWISRRRVYLYVEGDWSEPPPRSRKSLDLSYLRGVAEAKQAYEIIKAKTLVRMGENEDKERLHPQPYTKIRVNRAVPPVKLHQNLEAVGKCECDPNEENPCGLETNCLNRVLYHECSRKICPAGERCQNQMFEARISPALQIFYAKKERGFGLRCREPILAGTFIIEYVGEVIDSIEFDRRMQQKSNDRDENYYFLHVEKDYIIDAGPKGNMARFMNHSCDPNCETQKWSVNGLNRVGLFAIKDIPADTELTFNYHWDELLGNDKKVCYCGSENCTGQIGKISKDFKTKHLNADELLMNKNSKSPKTDQSKTQKKKHRKNNHKLMQQKHNQNDRKTINKPKYKRNKIQVNSSAPEPVELDVEKVEN